jgi:4-hydroxybenzoate polyprenyltransferase
VTNWVRALRPRQWAKNGFVLAPLLFAGELRLGGLLYAALLAAGAFSLAASGTYLVNDIVDREADRKHPKKKHRPIAAGAISTTQALVAAALLFGVATTIAFLTSARVGVFLLIYIALTQAYNFGLKKVVVVDAFVLSIGFVLRLLAGAAAIEVEVTIWLLLCGGLLALFLAFAKRRHELIVLGAESGSHRAVLRDYTTSFVDQASTVLLSTTLFSYVMYTITSETAQEVGSDAFAFSALFVVFGMLRYLFLVDRGAAGDPTDALFKDYQLLGTVIIWIGYCAWILR